MRNLALAYLFICAALFASWQCFATSVTTTGAGVVAAVGGGNVTVDQVGAQIVDTGGVATFNYTGITVNTGDTMLLLVISPNFNLHNGSWATVTATYSTTTPFSSTPMTELSFSPISTGNNQQHIFFALGSPTVGTGGTIVVTWAGGTAGTARVSCNAVTFKGSNTSVASAFPAAGQNYNYSASTSSTSPAVSVTSATGHQVMGFATALFGAPPTLSFSTTTTSDWSCNNSPNNCLSWVGGHGAGAGTVTLTASQSPADNLLTSELDVSP